MSFGFLLLVSALSLIVTIECLEQRRLSCGSVHTCFVTRFNATRCWGFESTSMLLLGHGNLTLAGSGFVLARTIRDVGDVSALPAPTVAVLTSTEASCALLSTGRVWCWGRSTTPILADRRVVDDVDDDPDFGRIPSPVAALDSIDERVLQLVLGRRHACALLESRRVSCWGDNADGQLGFGPSPLPAVRDFVPLRFNVSMLAAGQSHTCALSVAGDVFCWGSNDQYQLGLANNTSPVPAAAINASLVPLPTDAYSAIASGARHTCAISRTTKTLRCWGSGAAGRLGYGGTLPVAGVADTSSVKNLTSLPPVPLNGTVAAVACGSQHTCVLFDAGTVQCFGANATGRLGYPTLSEVGALPTTTPDKFRTVDLPLPVIAISAGDEHSCALVNNGSVYCWGAGNTGQLGYNNATLNVGSTLALLPRLVGPVDVGDDIITTTTILTTTTTTTSTASTTSASMSSVDASTTSKSRGILGTPEPVEVFPWWAILILVLAILLCIFCIWLLVALLRRRRKDKDEDAEQKRTPRVADEEGFKPGVAAFTAGTMTQMDTVATEAGEDATSSSSSSSKESSEQERKKRRRHKK
jgi:alpha-tubulin suppressor-like RCC1 family protein